MSQATSYLPIGTVSELTGVNAVTLRAWERRYGLVKPVRTPKGHRMYATADVEMIRTVRKLVEQGVPISQCRTALGAETTVASTVAESGNVWNDYRSVMAEAISEFDEFKLDAAYQEAMSLYPVDVVTQRLMIPLLQKLGAQWAQSNTGIAEEHFFGVFMRNKLGARFHHRQRSSRGAKLLAACLPGEQHEIGLLLFALAAHDRGYRLILLGADMPLEQMPYVSEHTAVNAVVLSSSAPPPADTLGEKLKTLVANSQCPVFIGGKTADRYHEKIEQAGAIPVGTDLANGLDIIANKLKAHLNA